MILEERHMPRTDLTLVRQHQAQIRKNGLVAADRTRFQLRNERLFGAKRVIRASDTIAGRLTKPGQDKPKSTVVVVGEAPDGFGKQVLWDPSDTALALIVFLNAADYLGVMISGVKQNDIIEIISATGLASFGEDTENEFAGAIIGIIAAGATATATAFGAPEAAPVIAAAAEFANTQFKQKQVKTLRRDPFGEDPGDGLKARQEGGVLVSGPAARQIYYSGDNDHEERWIKQPGTRDGAHLPDHVKHGAFLRSGVNFKDRASADGDIIIYPWDFDFLDNVGFYRLHVLVHHGPPPVVN
jgi:hypothetical protein